MMMMMMIITIMIPSCTFSFQLRASLVWRFSIDDINIDRSSGYSVVIDHLFGGAGLIWSLTYLVELHHEMK